MKSRGKILSLLLAICLVVGLLPTMAFAANGDKAIMLGASQLKGRQVSRVYFGTYQQSDNGNGGYNTDPVKWRVLANDEEGSGTLFLLSDQNLDVFQYHTDNESVTWEKSTMRSWLNGYDASQNIGGDSGIDYTEDNFLDTAFSEKEQEAISETAVTDNDNTEYEVDGGNDTTDRIFLSSFAETYNRNYFPNYGLSTNTAYVAGGGKSGRGMNEAGEADRWWLRSPGYDISMAAYIEDDGSQVSDGNPVTDKATAVRPAFNLDLDSVLFTSAAAGGKAGDGGLTAVADYDGSEWKLTLLDKARNFEISDAATNSIGDTIVFSYSGAQTGEKEYISVVIEVSGAITYYGRILHLDGTTNGASGVASLALPDGVTLGDTTKLYVFNEQYNGGENDDTRLTDYGSQLIEVNPTVDETAPALTSGGATRDSDATATVTFTSDEAGTYYYAIAESGATAPDIETSGTGAACIIGENTISIDGLEGAGEKDIYIVVKDAVGNVSETLSLTIPAATYSISASPAELDFGSKTARYTEAPDGQPVTIQNTGNQTVTVDLPASTDYYAITEGAGFENGAATLEPDDTAAFAVQPKTGLAAGDYDELLTISGTNDVTDTVQLRFTVTRRSSSAAGGGGSYPVDLEASVAVETAQHGKVTSSASRAGSDTTVTLTAVPDEGYALESLTVTENSSGSEVKTTDQGDGTFTFIMPAGSVTVEAVFLPEDTAYDDGEESPLAAYTDLDTEAWYHDGIHYCLEEGLMNGTGDGLFSPDATLTRAQAVTVLWRLENEPAVNDTMSFADVAEEQWYSEAVRWAASEKLVEGYSDTEFGTGDAITREQLAAILSRYAAYKGYDVSADGDLGVFTDASEISDWAYEAMQWAYGVGLMEGDAGILNPTGDTRRCEFATMMMRFVENIAK